MTISVLLFASAREKAGTDSIELPVTPPVLVSDLQAALVIACPALRPLAGSLLWAVNSRYANHHDTVEVSDVVACFPPVSGG